MTDVTRCFRSGNTLRITLNKRARYNLAAEPGDLLCIETEKRGEATIVNLSHQQRTAKKEHRK